MALSTHVLDLVTGRPIAGMAVTAHVQRGDAWIAAGAGTTDEAGRISDLLAGQPLQPTVYRLTFATAAHFAGQSFYPEVTITFVVSDPSQHHHVPLLLGPYGYTTYRGS